MFRGHLFLTHVLNLRCCEVTFLPGRIELRFVDALKTISDTLDAANEELADHMQVAEMSGVSEELLVSMMGRWKASTTPNPGKPQQPQSHMLQAADQNRGDQGEGSSTVPWPCKMHGSKSLPKHAQQWSPGVQN